MRGFLLFLIGALGVTEPFMVVRWASPEHQTVSIDVPGLQGDVDECLAEGRQARVRLEIRLCRKRSAWLDRCEYARSELHTVEFDGITESYRVVSDRFGDVSEATAVGLPVRENAVDQVLRSESLPLAFLARETPGLLQDPGAYISVRTIFRCKGASTRTFAHLSLFLSLGLVNTVESTSEWSDFPLFSAVEESPGASE